MKQRTIGKSRLSPGSFKESVVQQVTESEVGGGGRKGHQEAQSQLKKIGSKEKGKKGKVQAWVGGGDSWRQSLAGKVV